MSSSSAENPEKISLSHKPEYPSLHTCYIASQGGKWNIFASHTFFYQIYFWKLAYVRGLEGIEVERGENKVFQCAQAQPKSWGQCNFLKDSHNIAKNISVHNALST